MPEKNHQVDPDPLGGRQDSATSIFTSNSIAEIRAILDQLGEQEATVTARLDSLLASQKDLSRELGRLDILRAQLGTQALAARTIRNGALSDSASVARRISGAVKCLDLEQTRVKATLEVVEQVAELKACVLGVTTSMGASHDWERAAGYLGRASRIPKEIIHGQFAEEMVPTAEVPDPPSVTLESAADSLCRLFLREFEKAAKEGDGPRITRFFKLFPLIGRSDVGLNVYGGYVCQGVASRTRANLNTGTGANQPKDGFVYANALTKLFEHIAQVLDGHGGLIERHYGAGKMIKVIERLQLEVDMQGGLIIDTWVDERKIDRQLSEVRSYAFSFLVRSFLPQQRPGGSLRPTHISSESAPTKRIGQEKEGVDMREVDGILNELAIMLGRWSLYCRFLAIQCQEDAGNRSENDSAPLTIPVIISKSSLNRKISERLILFFNTFGTFFFRRSVERAFQLDEQPLGLSLDLQKSLGSNPPYMMSAVDDVMYIVDKIIQRSLATSQRAVVAGVIPSVSRVLGSDFIGMIQRKMRDECYPKAVVQGSLPPEDKVIAFSVLINSLDLAGEYVSRIVQSRLNPEASTTDNNQQSTPTPLKDLFSFDQDARFVADSLRSLEHSFRTKTSELLNDGIYVIFERVIKPRLRPMLANAFRNINYLITEDDQIPGRDRAEDEGNSGADDPDDESLLVKHRFERSWNGLTLPLRRILTERNFDKLLSTTVAYFSTKVLEKRIWSYHGRVNDLGAVRIERDVTNIIRIVVKGGNRYGLRDAFLRCTQVCLVMTMEEDEWEEEAGSDEPSGGGGALDEAKSIQWKLTWDERLRARAMLVKDHNQHF